jgi:outer membrane protein W
MKKIRKPVLILLCLFIWAGTASAQGKKLRVTATTAKIYIEPHTKSTVIGTVQKGAVLTLFDAGSQGKAWYYVSFYSEEKWATITGFVEASRVELMGAPEKPEPEKPEVPETKKAPPQKPPPKKSVKTEPPPKAVVKPQEKPKVQQKAAEPVQTEPARPEAELEHLSGELKITGEKPAIRAQASESGRILLVAKFGWVLELTGRKADWFRVKYPRPDGIVLVGFLHEGQVEVLSGIAGEAKTEAVEPPAAAVPEIPVAEVPEKPEETVPPKIQKQEPAPPRAGLGRLSGGLLSGVVQAGYALPSESAYGGDMVFGGGISYLVTPNVAVEVALYRTQSEVEGTLDGLSTGKLTMMPVSLSLQGRYPLGNRLIPYAQVGVAYNFLDFKLCSICQSEWEDMGFAISEEIDNSIGFQVGAGLDYRITDRIALNVDLRYQILNGQGTWSMSDQLSGVSQSGDLNDLNMSALVFRIGAKFFLKIF